MKRIIVKVLMMLFPERCAKILQRRRERRIAMQEMLDRSRALREKGCAADEINDRMAASLRLYARGKFNLAANCSGMA